METKVEEENGSVKTQKILKISIIITSIISVFVLILLIVFMVQDAKTLKISIDDVQYKVKESQINVNNETYLLGTIDYVKDNKVETKNLVLTDSSGTVYFSIETLADIQGYTYTMGESLKVTQDKEKCHVTYPNGEDVSFSAGSKEFFKVVEPPETNGNNSELTSEESQYENYTAKNEVKFINDELFAPTEMIIKGFNNIVIDDSPTQYRLYSLKYLIDTCNSQISSKGYTPSTIYKNQRALVEGIAIVSKSDSGSQSGAKYGLYSINNNSNITDMNFDTIEYLQDIDKYIVSSDGKYGIIEVKQDGENFLTNEVISLDYDSISVLDAQKGLYIIKKLDSYGVILDTGETVIPAEYSSIGVGDITAYQEQGITNPYIFFDKCIPVERDGRYGMFVVDIKEDDKGNKEVSVSNTLDATNSNYVGFGCSNAESAYSSGENVLIIPEEAGLGFKGLVVKSALGKYAVMSAETGAMQTTAIYDYIYSVTRDETTTYYAISASQSEPLLLKDVINLYAGGGTSN